MVSITPSSRVFDKFGKVKLLDFEHSEMSGNTSHEVYWLVRLSKTGRYERPYNVTGVIKPTGAYQRPKGICKDSNNGTRKA